MVKIKETPEKPKPSGSPMYIASLEVSNVKCFGSKQVLDLTDGKGKISPWTLILGDNGVGKTTLLKCLAWMTPVIAPEKEKEAIDRARDQIAVKLKEENINHNIISRVTTIEIIDLEKLFNKKEEKINPKELDAFEKIAVEREKEKIAKRLKYEGVNVNVICKVSDLSLDHISTLSEDHPKTKIKIKPLMDESEDERIFEKITRVGDNVNTSIWGGFSVGVSLGEIPSNIVKVGIYIERINGKLVTITPEKDEVEVDAFTSPKIYAFNASRHMVSDNYDNPELKEPTNNLFSESGDLYDAEQLLSNLNSSVNQERIEQFEAKEKGEGGKGINIQEGKLTSLLSKIKHILKDMLFLDKTDSIIINPPFTKDGVQNENLVEVKTPYGKVSIRELSLGYKTMFSFTVELALRMFWENPESETPLETQGIVIIDEIDLHLHPKWQRTIKGNLTKHFPNTQFICTAHSPLMAQSSNSDNLRIVVRHGKEVKIESNPLNIKNWSIDQILTSDIFGLNTAIDPPVQKLMDKRKEILSKSTITQKDKLELEKVERKLGEVPTHTNKSEMLAFSAIDKVAALLNLKINGED